jgi:hypothetical protein
MIRKGTILIVIGSILYLILLVISIFSIGETHINGKRYFFNILINSGFDFGLFTFSLLYFCFSLLIIGYGVSLNDNEKKEAGEGK